MDNSSASCQPIIIAIAACRELLSLQRARSSSSWGIFSYSASVACVANAEGERWYCIQRLSETLRTD